MVGTKHTDLSERTVEEHLTAVYAGAFNAVWGSRSFYPPFTIDAVDIPPPRGRPLHESVPDRVYLGTARSFPPAMGGPIGIWQR
jgi:hypothetical protein